VDDGIDAAERRHCRGERGLAGGCGERVKLEDYERAGVCVRAKCGEEGRIEVGARAAGSKGGTESEETDAEGVAKRREGASQEVAFWLLGRGIGVGHAGKSLSKRGTVWGAVIGPSSHTYLSTYVCIEWDDMQVPCFRGITGIK